MVRTIPLVAPGRRCVGGGFASQPSFLLDALCRFLGVGDDIGVLDGGGLLEHVILDRRVAAVRQVDADATARSGYYSDTSGKVKYH